MFPEPSSTRRSEPRGKKKSPDKIHFSKSPVKEPLSMFPNRASVERDALSPDLMAYSFIHSYLSGFPSYEALP
jgi:hypothetical protein